MIMAITGRRGRPPNPDKEKPARVRALKRGQARRPGRPPKIKTVDLLSKVDAKLLKRLQAKGEFVLIFRFVYVVWLSADCCLLSCSDRNSDRGGQGETGKNQKENEKKGTPDCV